MFLRGNPIYKWMMIRGTPMYGNPHLAWNILEFTTVADIRVKEFSCD
jgi:hypothetical protein